MKTSITAALPLAVFAAAASAHEGHAATPVHVHIAWLPVDLGLIVAAVVVAIAAGAVVKRRRA